MYNYKLTIMMAEKKSEQKWYGNGDVTADQGGKPNGGVATETQGREDSPDLYEDDVMGKVAKRNEDNIWTRGGMKRIRHKEDE